MFGHRKLRTRNAYTGAPVWTWVQGAGTRRRTAGVACRVSHGVALVQVPARCLQVPTTRDGGHVSITARWVVELWMSCNKEKSSADAALRRERVGTRLYAVYYGRCRVDMCVLFVAIFAKNGDFRQSYREPLGTMLLLINKIKG